MKEKLTVKEIINILESNNISVSDFAYGNFKLPELGTWEEVEKTGGADQGSYWSSVKYFRDHDVYIRTIGYYQSHYGTDFYNGYGEQVIPKEVKVVKYITI